MWKKRNILVAVAASVLTVGPIAACTYEVEPTAIVDGESVAAAPSVAAIAPEAAVAETDPYPEEAETIGVMRAIFREQIAEAELGRTRSFTPTVFYFADFVRTEDEEARRRHDAVVSNLDLATDDGPWVTTRERSEDAIARLSQLEGPAFDVAYLERQVAAQSELIALVDGVLAPRAMHAETRAELGHLRSKLVVELERARTLASFLSLDSGAP